MSWFDEQHAVVTGGASGIGAAIARALAGCGSRVTLIGRNADRLAARALELEVSHQAADVSQRDQVRSAFAAASGDNGPVTILVNNAGIADAAPLSRMDDELWDTMLAVNLTGVYNCTRAVLAAMLQARSGRIINIASTAALTGYAYASAYCASKHGVLGLTRALALELALKGITVNAVCPGYTNTEMIDRAIDNIVAKTKRSRDEARAELVKVNPQKRLIEPAEVAETVLWVCRQPAINGQAIAVAGGEIM